MSNQRDIIEAIEAKVATLLGSDWSELDYTYDLEKNKKFKDKETKWGVGVSEGTPLSGTNKSVTLEEEYFVVLAKNFTNRSNDESEKEAIKTIYDSLDVLYLDFARSKLGLPAIVFVVSLPNPLGPETMGESTTSVRLNFTVQHRKSTT